MKFAKTKLVATAFIASLAVGCGGDDAAGKGMSVSGGVDPVKQIAEENLKKKADPNDPNYKKITENNRENQARVPGTSSGGATSSAVLD